MKFIRQVLYQVFYMIQQKFKNTAENDSIENLPLQPINSNCGMASYHLAKYLEKLLSPHSQWEFTVKNGKAFIQEIKNMLPTDGYELISFDVTSLFANVSLDYTINIILKRIYDKRRLETKISRKKWKIFCYLILKMYIYFLLINCTLEGMVL